MSDEGLRNAWHAHELDIPISTALNFGRDGLVLGAGTAIIAAEGSPRRLKSPRGDEPRVLALLCAAYGKPGPPTVLGNIKRAAKYWNEGDDCLAYVHLAHARLGELPNPYEASRRLWLADGFIKAGGNPRSAQG